MIYLINDEYLSLISEITAKMYFPYHNDKRKRNVFVNYLEKRPRKQTDYSEEKIREVLESAHKSTKKGFVAGEFFRIQLAFCFEKEDPPSIRLLESYIKENNIYKNFQDYPFNSVRKYIRLFGPVVHFWAAEAYFYSLEKKYSFTKVLWSNPEFYLTIVNYFREVAINFGIDQQHELWMPNNWKYCINNETIQDVRTSSGLKVLVQEIKKYRNTYDNEKKWEFC